MNPAVAVLREQLTFARCDQDGLRSVHFAAMEAESEARKASISTRKAMHEGSARVSGYLAALHALGIKEPIRPECELAPGWEVGDVTDWPTTATVLKGTK